MVEFFGERSEASRAALVKRNITKAALVFVYLSLAFVPLTIVCAVVKSNLLNWLTIQTVALGLVSILLFDLANFLSEQVQGASLVERLTIDGGYVTLRIQMSTREKTKTKPVRKVKKVLDLGSEYYIFFGILSSVWVCEKHLLTKGTIKDFEEIFLKKLKLQQRERA